MRLSNVSVICCVLAGWVTGSAAQAEVIAQPDAALTSSGRALQALDPCVPGVLLSFGIAVDCEENHSDCGAKGSNT